MDSWGKFICLIKTGNFPSGGKHLVQQWVAERERERGGGRGSIKDVLTDLGIWELRIAIS